MGRVTVHPDKGAAVLLTDADHVATGGEGSVYIKAGKIYKVYLDPALAISAGVDRKIPLLAAIQHPGIVAPQGALRDNHGQFLGLYMDRAPGEALCRAFTTSWRDSVGMVDDDTVKLTDGMRDIVLAAHAHHALMIDANEMNWLVDRRTAPSIIDVDSWALPGFPPRAMMASIRDYSANGFSPGTDWFAWAVVSFQLWTGIHPYKGIHPEFGRGNIEARMRARASVFDPKVRVPPAARPIQNIPPRLRAWYESVFQGADRSEPPKASASAIAIQTAPKLAIRQGSDGTVKIERFATLPGTIRMVADGLAIWSDPNHWGAFDLSDRTNLAGYASAELQAIVDGTAATCLTDDGRILVRIVSGGLEVSLPALGSSIKANLPLKARTLWSADNRVFGVVDGMSDGLVELDLRILAGRPIAAIARQWPVAGLSTRLYRGVFIQDCLGIPFLGVPFKGGVVMGNAASLKAFRITDGLAVDPENVWLSAFRKSDGERLLLRCGGDMAGFKIHDEQLIDEPLVNAAASSAGIGVLLLESTLRVVRASLRKSVPAPHLDPTLRLIPLQAGIGAYSGSEIVKLSLS